MLASRPVSSQGQDQRSETSTTEHTIIPPTHREWTHPDPLQSETRRLTYFARTCGGTTWQDSVGDKAVRHRSRACGASFWELPPPRSPCGVARTMATLVHCVMTRHPEPKTAHHTCPGSQEEVHGDVCWSHMVRPVSKYDSLLDFIFPDARALFDGQMTDPHPLLHHNGELTAARHQHPAETLFETPLRSHHGSAKQSQTKHSWTATPHPQRENCLDPMHRKKTLQQRADETNTTGIWIGVGNIFAIAPRYLANECHEAQNNYIPVLF